MNSLCKRSRSCALVHLLNVLGAGPPRATSLAIGVDTLVEGSARCDPVPVVSAASCPREASLHSLGPANAGRVLTSTWSLEEPGAQLIAHLLVSWTGPAVRPAEREAWAAGRSEVVVAYRAAGPG